MMTVQDMHSPRALLALLVFLAAPLLASAQVSTEVRLCLQDYALLSRSGDKAGALDKLRDCAKQHPNEFALQKTLGKKLAEEHEKTGDAALGTEAVAAYQAAAKLNPTKFASLWGDLAALQQALGRDQDAIASWESALPELMISERQGAQDALWDLYREAGEDEKAFGLWSDVSYRMSDDFDSVMYAAKLHQDRERFDDAKDLYKRGLDLRPDDAGAQAAYNDILAKTAASGGSSEKNALLDAWLPKLGEADDAFLGELMGMTREVFNPQAERAVAEEMLRRNPDSAQANLSIGDAKLAEGDEAGAERALKKALAGDLSDSDRGRAHAVLGRMVEQRTYARYAAGGSSVGETEIRTAERGYDQALSHYRKAAAAGADVDDEIDNVRAAKAALRGVTVVLDSEKRKAAKKACSELANDAQYGYDRGKAIARTVKSDTGLSRSAGGSADSSNVAAGGASVSLMTAQWSGGTCWVKVKLADGRSGWLEKSATR